MCAVTYNYIAKDIADELALNDSRPMFSRCTSHLEVAVL